MKCVKYKVLNSIGDFRIPKFGRVYIEVESESDVRFAVKQVVNSKIFIDGDGLIKKVGSSTVNSKEYICTGNMEQFTFSSGHYCISLDKFNLSDIVNSDTSVESSGNALKYKNLDHSSITRFYDIFSPVNMSEFIGCASLNKLYIRKAVGNIESLKDYTLTEFRANSNYGLLGNIGDIVNSSITLLQCNFTDLQGDVSECMVCTSLKELTIGYCHIGGNAGVLKNIPLTYLNIVSSQVVCEILDLTVNTRTSETLRVNPNQYVTINGEKEYAGIKATQNIYIHYVSQPTYHAVINNSSSDATNGIKVDTSGNIVS